MKDNAGNMFDRIQKFNSGRDKHLLELKYGKLADNVFSFYRGTAHLFFEDWPNDTVLNSCPDVWLCGDLHLENFGSYKGDNRLVYFDLNDFDEAGLGAASLDLSRFLVSLILVADITKLSAEQQQYLTNLFLSEYSGALSLGKAHSVETRTSPGMVKKLLKAVSQRDRNTFLNSRTKLKGGVRHLLADGKRANPVTPEVKDQLQVFLKTVEHLKYPPRFFDMIDAARRICGTGSLGLERYVILVRGYGAPNSNYLLDMKFEPPSALAPYLKSPQPAWRNEAERVVSVQRRMQATSQALLAAVEFNGRPFLLRELQPTNDKVDLHTMKNKFKRFQKTIALMGKMVAWAQLRSSGRQGSAIADTLIEFGRETNWHALLQQYARDYAVQVKQDYKSFVTSYSQM